MTKQEMTNGVKDTRNEAGHALITQLTTHQHVAMADHYVVMAQKHIAAAREQLALAQEQIVMAQEQVAAAVPQVRAIQRLALSMNETAEALGLSHTEVYRLVATAELRSIKIGRRRLVPTGALEAFITRRITREM